MASNTNEQQKTTHNQGSKVNEEHCQESPGHQASRIGGMDLIRDGLITIPNKHCIPSEKALLDNLDLWNKQVFNVSPF